MQIVIDIDDEDYKKVLDANNRDVGWNIAHACYEAVLDGTPLPKGHGKLVDINSIPKEDRHITVKSLLHPGTIAHAGAITLEEYANSLPTIIEADRSVEE